jgi:hypothetical protein
MDRYHYLQLVSNNSRMTSKGTSKMQRVIKMQIVMKQNKSFKWQQHTNFTSEMKLLKRPEVQKRFRQCLTTIGADVIACSE